MVGVWDPRVLVELQAIADLAHSRHDAEPTEGVGSW
jgi:hypothetical protein